jgi:hypothetical protein
MNIRQRSRPPVGPQPVTPARARSPKTAPVQPVVLDPAASPHYTANAPDPVMQQAKRDLDAGLVDTDMRATPGLDAALRAKLVPGPGGKPPAGKG